MLLLLLAIGTGYDLWRAWRPVARHSPQLLPPDPLPSAALDTAAAPRALADTAVLDLNRAGAAELDALPGIGPVLARRIVEFRRQHGPFRRVEELRAVRGVGPRLLERLKPRVAVGGIPPAAP